MPRDASVNTHTGGDWVNAHQNVVQQVDCWYDVWNPPAPVTDGWSDMKLTVAKLQSLSAQAVQDNVRLRAFGGAWALSPVAVTNGRLINTKPLNWWFPLRPNHISPGYTGVPANVIFAQCGISVLELNDHLAQRGSALKTSGASNWQTIVGAVSTGTHGSALEVGSMQDYVVGMHIIVSPDRHIWLERQSYPVVSQEFVAKLGAGLMRDDTLFNAALISFGSFGIIHALALEVEPAYLLDASRSRMPVDAALRASMDTLNYDSLPLPSPADKPFHFEVVINPHDVVHGAYVTAMYKRPYRQNYTPPQQLQGGLAPGDDLLATIGVIGDVVPGLVPATVNGFVGINYPLYTNREGTPGELFTAISVHGKGMGMEVGVAAEDASRVLDCLLALNTNKGPFCGVFAFRFVKQSKALLAFTKFPYTCTVEFPGVYSDQTAAFHHAVWQQLWDLGIPYTMHWGQVNQYNAVNVRAMYGAPVVERWIQSRNTILDARMRELFSSPYLETCGLDGKYAEPVRVPAA